MLKFFSTFSKVFSGQKNIQTGNFLKKINLNCRNYTGGSRKNHKPILRSSEKNRF